MGKIRNPQYRIVVADSRTKRDGRAIEYVGIYHPKEDPSLIEVKSERVQHWLSVGAQPSEAVQRDPREDRRLAEVQGPAGPAAAAGRRAERADRRAAYEAEAQGRGRRLTEAAGRSRQEGQGRQKAEPKAAEGRRLPKRRRPPRPRRAKAEASRDREASPRPRSRPVPAPASRPDVALRPALEHLVKGIVDHPDDVRVRWSTPAAASGSRCVSTPRTWARSSGGAGAPPRRCARSSGRSVAGASGSTSSTRTDRHAARRRPDRSPHGVRGEVVVEVRTDEPEQRFAAGSVLVTDPAAAAPARRAGQRSTVETGRARHQGRLLVALRRRRRPRPRRRRCAACCSASTAPTSAPTGRPGRVPRPPAGRAGRGRAAGGEELGEVARIDHAPASRPARAAPAGRRVPRWSRS